MIFGAIQAVDFSKNPEALNANSDILKALCSKKDIANLPVNQQAILFATISRFIAHHEAFDCAQAMEKAFKEFKDRFGQTLASSNDLDIHDVTHLI